MENWKRAWRSTEEEREDGREGKEERDGWMSC
jgi:hypothetical protein